MSHLLSIGAFARLTGLSIKALRHYDALNVLRPAIVDPSSGYRYFELEQLSVARTVALLRSIGLPLEEVRELMQAPEATRRDILSRHHHRLQTQLAEVKNQLEGLAQQLGFHAPNVYTCAVKELRPQRVLSVRASVSPAEAGRHVSRSVLALLSVVERTGASVAGSPMTLYHPTDAADEDLIDQEIAVPFTGPVEGDEQHRVRELPGGRVAFALHRGSYDDIPVGNSAILQWMRDNGFEPCEPRREVYRVTPGHVADPSSFETELQWPIAAETV
jgi:DNA-binding transcriptional MerR regulator